MAGRPARTSGGWWALRAVALAAATLAIAAAAHAQATADIASAGPLEHVWLGSDLSCQVAHTLDGTVYELYPPSAVPGDCGTFLRLGGTLYGPDFTAHTGGTATPFTPGFGTPMYEVHSFVSQTPVSGAGTSASPYKVTTVVEAGGTGVTLEQEDRYVVGQELYTTKMTVTNGGASPVSARLWRAGDCFLGATDEGYGMLDLATGEVGCSDNAYNSPPGRIEVWRPITPGSKALHDQFGVVWDTIANGMPFPDTCLCTTLIDNGAGLSWDFTLDPGASATFEHDLLFSPTGAIPNTPPTGTLVVDASARDCRDSAVLFSFSAADADGSVASWRLDFGDGEWASGTGTVGGGTTHTYAEAGIYTATFTVTDDDGDSTVVTAPVDSVGDPNCCPVMEPLFDATIKEGRTVRILPLTGDPDNGRLTFRVSPEPGPATMFDPATGSWEWMTFAGDAGDYGFVVTASDGQCEVTRSFMVHVLGGPQAPAVDDQDRDGVADDQDNCPSVPNTSQADADLDGTGDACSDRWEATRSEADRRAADAGLPDTDGDGVADASDVCPALPDARQADLDLDREGDACDADLDGDGVPQQGEFPDACPLVPDPGQEDADADGLGDACDPSGGRRASAAAAAAASKAKGGAPAPATGGGGAAAPAPAGLPPAALALGGLGLLAAAGLGSGLVAWAARRGR